MTGFETRTHCVCFTGHRPEKLSSSEAEVKAGLTEQIKKAIADGYPGAFSKKFLKLAES